MRRKFDICTKIFLSLFLVLFAAVPMFSVIKIDSAKFKNALFSPKIFYVPFRGRVVQIYHVNEKSSDPKVQKDIRLGAYVYAIMDRPVVLSSRNGQKLKEAIKLYSSRKFDEALAIYSKLYNEEKENPFYLYHTARALYRSYYTAYMSTKNRKYFFRASYDYFSRLIEHLDKKYGTNEKRIAVDMWFVDAYWKMGCMYMDTGEFKKAIFEICRALTAGGRYTNIYPQALNFLTEAYHRLKEYGIAQQLGFYTLTLYPKNNYVRKYLSPPGQKKKNSKTKEE